MKKLMFLFLMLTVIFGYSRLSVAEEGSPTTTAPAMKIYAVYFDAANGGWYNLADMEIVDFKGIKCLKGKHITTHDSWLKNRVVYIPVDKVTSIVVFNSLADFSETPEKNIESDPIKNNKSDGHN